MMETVPIPANKPEVEPDHEFDIIKELYSSLKDYSNEVNKDFLPDRDKQHLINHVVRDSETGELALDEEHTNDPQMQNWLERLKRNQHNKHRRQWASRVLPNILLLDALGFLTKERGNGLEQYIERIEELNDEMALIAPPLDTSVVESDEVKSDRFEKTKEIVKETDELLEKLFAKYVDQKVLARVIDSRLEEERKAA